MRYSINMENLIREFEKQTQNVTGDETFIFAYNNPNVFRGTGAVVIGDEDQRARLLAGVINTLSDDAKDLLLSYMVIDDPNAVIAAAYAYLEQSQENKQE